MILPAIGEVPNWLIAYAAVAAVILAYVVRRFLRNRTQKVETLVDLIAVDIRNLFIRSSQFVRSLQVDTINADTTLLAVGIVLILILYLVVMLW